MRRIRIWPKAIGPDGSVTAAEGSAVGRVVLTEVHLAHTASA